MPQPGSQQMSWSGQTRPCVIIQRIIMLKTVLNCPYVFCLLCFKNMLRFENGVMWIQPKKAAVKVSRQSGKTFSDKGEHTNTTNVRVTDALQRLSTCFFFSFFLSNLMSDKALWPPASAQTCLCDVVFLRFCGSSLSVSKDWNKKLFLLMKAAVQSVQRWITALECQTYQSAWRFDWTMKRIRWTAEGEPFWIFQVLTCTVIWCDGG